MQTGAITGYIDVAQIALYAFWLFFAGLVFYLRREDKREGYPLVTERPGHFLEGFPRLPAPKTFLLPNGGTVTAPRVDAPQTRLRLRRPSQPGPARRWSQSATRCWPAPDPPPPLCVRTAPDRMQEMPENRWSVARRNRSLSG